MGWVVNATPRPLTPGKTPGNHCIGGWVCPKAGLDGCRRSRHTPEFDRRTLQPVAKNRHKRNTPSLSWKIILSAHSSNWLCWKGQPIVIAPWEQERPLAFTSVYHKTPIHHTATPPTSTWHRILYVRLWKHTNKKQLLFSIFIYIVFHSSTVHIRK